MGRYVEVVTSRTLKNQVIHQLKKFDVKWTFSWIFTLLTIYIPLDWFHAKWSEFHYIWGGGGDGLLAYSFVDGLAHGRLIVDQHFGFPNGLNWGFYPTGDWIQLTVAAITDRLFGLGTGIPLIFILSFPATLILARFCFKEIGVSLPFDWILAFSFTFIPWHFLRLGHVMLATTYGVAAGVLFCVRVIFNEKFHGKKQIINAFFLATLAALSGIYFAAFTMIMLVVSIAWKLMAGKIGNVRRVLIASVGYALIVLAGQIPFILAIPRHLSSALVSGRQIIESEIYGGRLIFLISPNPSSGLPLLRRPIQALHSLPADSESGLPSNFGTFTTTLAMITILIYLILSSANWSFRDNFQDKAKMWFSFLGLNTFVLLLFFLTYGPNLIFAYLVTPQIRAWNRLTPLLLLLFLMLGAVVLIGVLSKIKISRGTKNFFAMLLIAFIFVDQVSNMGSARGIVDQGIQRTTEARAYLMKLNSHLTRGCGILELPLVPFPENPPVVNLPDYELLLPALLDDAHRWSYGTMKNTPDNALQISYSKLQPNLLLAKAKSDGFCAIHLDRRGFAGRTYEDGLKKILGAPIAEGFGDYWVAFRL